MSVLKKMIGRVRSQVLDDTALVQSWSYLHEDLLASFETTVPELRWRTGAIEATPLAYDVIESVRPKKGLFFGFGYDEKTTSVLVYLDDAFAQIMSQSAFGDGADGLSYDPAVEVSRFDVLLFKGIMTRFYRKLHETLLSKGVEPPIPALFRLGEAISPHAFELAEDADQWVHVTLGMSASLRPQESDTDIEAKKDPKTAAQDVDAEDTKPKEMQDTKKAEQNWPDILFVSLLMPQNLYENSLSNRFKNEAVDETLTLEEGLQNWKSRVENSHTALRAVVESTRMTVAECTRLEIGQVIPLPGISLQQVSIEAELKNNRIQIASGALGIHKTKRALKIMEGVDPAFIYGADIFATKASDPASE